MSYYNLFELGSNILEQYVLSEAHLLKNNYSWEVYTLLKINDVDKSTYKKKIIKLIIKTQSNQFQTYKEYVSLIHYYDKRLCYETTHLSDNEISIGNGYSRWKYPTNNVVFITSNVVQVFATGSIIFHSSKEENENNTVSTD